jgi:hypothetical protein
LNNENRNIEKRFHNIRTDTVDCFAVDTFFDCLFGEISRQHIFEYLVNAAIQKKYPENYQSLRISEWFDFLWLYP